MFKGYGDIISCKVSINEDYSSRGYGFVCFRDPESASRALSESSSRSETIGVKFAPKSKADFRKVYNNIFIKNIPDGWDEPELKKAFEVFGNITSIYARKHNNGLTLSFAMAIKIPQTESTVPDVQPKQSKKWTTRK